jgi:hypothetical protein
MCKINLSCLGCARVNWNHFTTFEMTWLMCRLIKFSNDTSQQITTLLYIKRTCELNKSHVISTDEDPGLWIESFPVINLLVDIIRLATRFFQQVRYSHDIAVQPWVTWVTTLCCQPCNILVHHDYIRLVITTL